MLVRFVRWSTQTRVHRIDQRFSAILESHLVREVCFGVCACLVDIGFHHWSARCVKSNDLCSFTSESFDPMHNGIPVRNMRVESTSNSKGNLHHLGHRKV